MDINSLLLDEGFDLEVVEVFTKNKITPQLFKELTDEQMKELGFCLGDRMRLSNMIATMRAQNVERPRERQPTNVRCIVYNEH